MRKRLMMGVGVLLTVILSVAAVEFRSASAASTDALIQSWIPTEELEHLAPGSLGAFAEEWCPDGWERIKANDGRPLYLAVGLLTDESGSPYVEGTSEPYSTYSVLPVCEKR